MHNEEYKQMSSMIRAISGKSVGEIKESLQLESTAAYKKSLEQIAKDRTLRGLSSSDRKTLKKIADLMNKEKQMELIRKEDTEGTIDEALGFGDRMRAKSLIRQANTYYRNMDKVEKLAFKNSKDLSKVERSLGGMIADLKREFIDSSRYNQEIEKIVGDDAFFNFKEFADDAYEGMASAEAAFEEHVRQLKDNDPDAQETLDIFLDGLESANRSYGEFLRSAVIALEDSLDENLDETDTVAGDIALKDMPLGKKKDEEEVNEVKTNVFTLNDLDDNDAGVVIAMAKKAKVFLRSKKVSMTRQDVQLKGDKKKVFKLINSLPESVQINEKLGAGFMDARTLAGKIITGEVKLLTVKQGSPGKRGTSILATGKPSVMGAPPESIYIDASGNRPRGSGLAIGFSLDQVKGSVEIKRDGSARVELK